MRADHRQRDMEPMEHRGDSPFSGPISPELVLVSSAEDARWARERLPEPGAAIVRPAEPERLVAEPERLVVETERPVEKERPAEPERLRETEPLEVLDPRSLFAAAEATAGGR